MARFEVNEGLGFRETGASIAFDRFSIFDALRGSPLDYRPDGFIIDTGFAWLFLSGHGLQYRSVGFIEVYAGTITTMQYSPGLRHPIDITGLNVPVTEFFAWARATDDEAFRNALF